MTGLCVKNPTIHQLLYIIGARVRLSQGRAACLNQPRTQALKNAAYLV